MKNKPTRDAFDASVYPRTYAVSLGWKLFLGIFGVLVGFGGIAALLFLLRPHPHKADEPVWAVLLLSVTSAGLAAAGFYSALSALMYRVILTADGVEVIEPFRRRQLSRHGIRGRRMLSTQPSALLLVPQDESARKLKIPLMLKTDREFDAWIAQLADLDQQELTRSEQEVAAALPQNQTTWGTAPRDNEPHIRHLKLLAKCVNGATVVICVAGSYLSDYQHLLSATWIALPWVAVGLVGRFEPLYRFGTKRNDAHPDLSGVLILPGIVLTGHALTVAHTFDWSGPLTLAFAGGLALSAAALRADPWFRQQRWSAILICVFTLAYGFGAGFEINVLADPTTPSIYPTQVLGKRANRGSRANTYYLRIGPWGSVTGNDEIGVSAARYGATRTGDTVCIYVGKGALRVPWYEVRDCGPSSPGAAT